MEAVEKFMQSYFDERASLARAAEARGAPFVRRCFTAEYLAASKRKFEKANVYEKIIPSVVLNVKIQGDTATVITSEPCLNTSERHLYKLRATGHGWQIDGCAAECYLCEGSGVFHGDTCSKCDGKKWNFSGASIR